MNKISSANLRFLIVLLGALVYIPFIGDVHLLDWDEINFAESAREMIVTGNFRHVQIDYQPFYEKPPLFIWFQVISMKIFGINEFAARLPNAIFAILTLLSIQAIGEKLSGRVFSLFWALFYFVSLLPFIYAKSGIIDPVFNYFIFISIYLLYEVTSFKEFENYKIAKRKRTNQLLLSGLMLGLAILTKGPVAILVVFILLTVQFIFQKGKIKLGLFDLAIWLSVVTLVIGIWLSFEIKSNGFKFIDEFIKYQIRLFSTPDAGHAQPFYYHFLVVLIGCFPASVFIFPAFKNNKADTLELLKFKQWLITLLIIVLFLFSIVKTKILHYSSLTYLPITFLAAYQVERYIRLKQKFDTSVIFLSLFLTFLIGFSLAIIPWIGEHPESISKFIKDEFAQKCLNQKINWEWSHYFPGILFLIGFIALIYFYLNRKYISSLFLLLLISFLSFNWSYKSIFPQIEKYTQNTYINMLKDLRNKKAINSNLIFVATAGFKSYAHLFYFQKEAFKNETKEFRDSVIWKDYNSELYIIGKDPYFRREKWIPNCDTIERKNGYILLKVIKSSEQ